MPVGLTPGVGNAWQGKDKRIILVLNKIDLVPKAVVLQWLKRLRNEYPTIAFKASTQVILPTAPGVSNEGGSSPLLVPLPAVSWPWVPAWGSLEPSRRGGENAQKTGKNG